MKSSSRRAFLRQAAAGLLGFPLLSRDFLKSSRMDDSFFRISLAQWSLHRTFEAGKLAAADFAAIARE